MPTNWLNMTQIPYSMKGRITLLSQHTFLIIFFSLFVSTEM